MYDLASRALRAFRKSDAGAAAVELAMSLPLLALLAVGVADFGRIYFTTIAVANASRTGAYYGAQSTTKSGTYRDRTAARMRGDLGARRSSSASARSGGRLCLQPRGFFWRLRFSART